MALNDLKLPSLQEVRAALRKNVQKESNLSLVVRTGANTVRGLHNAHVLVRQRNVVFADAQPLKPRDNVLFGVQLVLCAVNAYHSWSELKKRAEPGQPPREVSDEQGVIDPGLVAGSVVGIGLNLRSAKTGQALYKKRPLSRYGRAYQSYLVALQAAQLGLHLRTAVAR